MTPKTDDRAAATAALDLDEAYDRNPGGDPPLRVVDYRRALRAAMVATRVTGPDVPEPWAGCGDSGAYQAGHRDALDTMALAVARALGVRDVG